MKEICKERRENFENLHLDRVNVLMLKLIEIILFSNNLLKTEKQKKIIKIKKRCDNAGENGSTRLASIRCAGGLAFDIMRQTCDWKTNVKNCDQIESKCETAVQLTLNPSSSFSSFCVFVFPLEKCH